MRAALAQRGRRRGWALLGQQVALGRRVARDRRARRVVGTHHAPPVLAVDGVRGVGAVRRPATRVLRCHARHRVFVARLAPLVLPLEDKPSSPPARPVQLTHHVFDRIGLLVLDLCGSVRIVGVDAVLAHKPEFLGPFRIVGVQGVQKGARAVVVAGGHVERRAVHVVSPAVEAVLERRVRAKGVPVKIAVDRHDGTRSILLLDHPAPVGEQVHRSLQIESGIQIIVDPLVADDPHEQPGRALERPHLFAQRGVVVSTFGEVAGVHRPRDRVHAVRVHRVDDAGVPKEVVRLDDVEPGARNTGRILRGLLKRSGRWYLVPLDSQHVWLPVDAPQVGVDAVDEQAALVERDVGHGARNVWRRGRRRRRWIELFELLCVRGAVDVWPVLRARKAIGHVVDHAPVSVSVRGPVCAEGVGLGLRRKERPVAVDAERAHGRRRG